MTRARVRIAVAAVMAFALIAAACGGDDDDTASNNSNGNSTTTAAKGDGPWGWPGDAKTGYLAPNQPDVNGDGKVVIGVLSPGDTHDKGYYESFVDQANSFAKDNGWTVTTVDKVPQSQAAQQARNICRQHPDMVAIAASELKDAIPVAQEDVCKGTVWYVAGGEGVTQTKYFVQTNDILSQSSYVAGVAAGLLMKDSGATKAGFITGPQASFTSDYAKGWEAGIKKEIPNASVVTTYTGDFNDSGKAVEAYNAQKSQGVGIVYPYLGGATFAVAGAAEKDNIPVLTPGTDNCAIPSPKFQISVIFDPGSYFAAALEPFKEGKLRVGTALTFHLGKDPVPTVKICKPTGDQKQVIDKLIEDIGNGTVNTGELTGLNDYKGYDPSKG